MTEPIFSETSMMRWKSSATVAMTMLCLTATVSRAQSTTTFMTSNSDWTSLTGCHITPGSIVVPGGWVYYSASTSPAAGAQMLGICGPIPEDVPPPTIGWTGPQTFPDFGTGGGGGSVDQFFTSQDDHGDNDQGDNNQGDDDHGHHDDGPHYVPTNDGPTNDGPTNDGPTNDGPPNNSDSPHNTVGLDTTSTPEPGSVILLGSGLIGLGARAIRRRKGTASSEE